MARTAAVTSVHAHNLMQFLRFDIFDRDQIEFWCPAYILCLKHSKRILENCPLFCKFAEFAMMVNHAPSSNWGILREIVILDFIIACGLSIMVFVCKYDFVQLAFTIVSIMASLVFAVGFPEHHTARIHPSQIRSYHNLFVYGNITISAMILIVAIGIILTRISNNILGPPVLSVNNSIVIFAIWSMFRSVAFTYHAAKHLGTCCGHV